MSHFMKQPRERARMSAITKTRWGTDGAPNKTKVVRLRVTPDQFDKIKQMAARAGVSVSELILAALKL